MFKQKNRIMLVHKWEALMRIQKPNKVLCPELSGSAFTLIYPGNTALSYVDIFAAVEVCFTDFCGDDKAVWRGCGNPVREIIRELFPFFPLGSMNIAFQPHKQDGIIRPDKFDYTVKHLGGKTFFEGRFDCQNAIQDSLTEKVRTVAEILSEIQPAIETKLGDQVIEKWCCNYLAPIPVAETLDTSFQIKEVRGRSWLMCTVYDQKRKSVLTAKFKIAEAAVIGAGFCPSNLSTKIAA